MERFHDTELDVTIKDVTKVPKAQFPNQALTEAVSSGCDNLEFVKFLIEESGATPTIETLTTVRAIFLSKYKTVNEEEKRIHKSIIEFLEDIFFKTRADELRLGLPHSLLQPYFALIELIARFQDRELQATYTSKPRTNLKHIDREVDELSMKICSFIKSHEIQTHDYYIKAAMYEELDACNATFVALKNELASVIKTYAIALNVAATAYKVFHTSYSQSLQVVAVTQDRVGSRNNPAKMLPSTMSFFDDVYTPDVAVLSDMNQWNYVRDMFHTFGKRYIKTIVRSKCGDEEYPDRRALIYKIATKMNLLQEDYAHRFSVIGNEARLIVDVKPSHFSLHPKPATLQTPAESLRWLGICWRPLKHILHP